MLRNTTAHITALALALLILAGGLAGVLMIAGHGITRGLSGARTESEQGAGSLVDGSAAAAFDRWVEEEHPFREPALEAIATLRYLLLRQAGEGAVLGRDAWLFTAEELERHPGDEQRLRERVAWVAARAGELSAAGVEVVVVLVPAKARAASAMVPVRLQSLAGDRRYRLAADLLRREGVTVVDPDGALGPGDFFRRDTHWRPQGAEAVAALVAGVTGPVGGSAFGVERREPLALEGDLTSFLPLPEWLRVPHLLPEEYRPVTSTGSAGGGLFDTPEIPVALVGTSYSADERWGFAAFLRRELAADVLNVAEQGLGPFEPLAAYLSGETIREIPPRLLIWEVPERYLTLPDYGLPPVDGDPS